MEGSLALAGVDLGDLYRGAMTPRQLWVRFQALPVDSYIKRVLAAEFADAEERANTLTGDDIDETLRMVM